MAARGQVFMIGLQISSNSWQQSGSNIYKCSLEAFTEIYVEHDSTFFWAKTKSETVLTVLTVYGRGHSRKDVKKEHSSN